MDLNLAVKTRDGKPWAADVSGIPCVFAVGDCTYPCVEEPGKPPGDWPLPPLPKIAYPGEEAAVVAAANVRIADKLIFDFEPRDTHGRTLGLHNLHWPWGAGMF